MAFNYTYRADDILGWDVDTRDLVENRDRELELYSTTIDDSFLNLNASNLTSGTVPSARMTGAYTGITGLGTLTGLAVSGTATVTASSGTAMRITNTGSGNSFLVEDSASTDTSPFVIDASGNVGIGVSSPSTKLEVSGNVQILGGNFVVNGQGTFINSSAEDGIILAPRIGGTGSYRVIFTPAILSASRTYTLPNVTGTLITTGNLSDITSVGTLASGSIPASLLTGTTLPATIVTSSLTTVGTITSGTWSGSFGAVSGANLTSLNASNISSGTLANARLPAAATNITSVGTLTGLTVDGASSSAISLGDNGLYAQVAGTSGYLLVGNNASDTAMYLRTSTAGAVNIGANNSTTLAVGNGSSTFTGNVYTTGDFQITTTSKNFIAQSPTTSSGNAAQWLSVFGLYILIRNTSTRNDKENFQPLNGIVTPSMIDDIDISLWNRKGATGFPEIGPMAEDMDDISPFLSIRGMDCDDEGNIVPTEPTGINQNSWLSLLTLGIQDIRQRLQQLETA
jgi:hypothetical protein